MPDSTPDAAYIARLFKIESGGDPSAVTGSNRGLGQFGPQEEARYGISDANRTDPNAQAAAVQREAQEHASTLRRSLGRDPSPGELYLTHQQGQAGGPALLSADPTTPAWQAIRPYYKSDAIAKQAITGNIPSDHPLYRQDANNVTAGAFRDLWINKFERGGGGGSGTIATASGPSVGVAGAPGILNGAQASSPTEDPNMTALVERAAQAMAPPAPAAPLPPIQIALPKGLSRARLLAAMQTPIGG